MKKKDKEYEIVARFEKNNHTYIISQPKEPPTKEELDYYYANLVKMLYN